MGEEDLHPKGFHQLAAGSPLTSMMCPTIVTHNDKPLVALGSGGSNRIRTALLQVLVRHLLGGASLEEAVNAPRIHFEGGETTVEKRTAHADLSNETLAALEEMAGELKVFEKPNIFFGGVHAAGLNGECVGDQRRGGISTLVE